MLSLLEVAVAEDILLRAIAEEVEAYLAEVAEVAELEAEDCLLYKKIRVY